MGKSSASVTIEWYYVTRALGVLVFLYGVFVDASPERGTIILAGAGLAGFDKVARSEPAAPAKKNNDG